MKKYPMYKQSGYSWFSDVPSDWEIKDLKHELKFQTGGTPSTKESRYYDGDNTWITISDMVGKVVSHGSQRITKEGVEVANIPLTPKGSLLYSFKLSVGQVAFADEDFYTNEAIASFLPSTKYDINYWYYALPFTLIHNANENIYGAKLLNQELIKNAVMIVPSKEEQQSIVRFLDYKTGQIDSFIANRQKQIELLKEQKAGIINKAVTKGINPDAKMKPSGIEWIGEIPKNWEVVKLKYVAKLQSGEAITADDIKEIGDYPVYGGNGLRGYTTNYTNDGNFVLIGRQGALCGNINYATGKFWSSEHAVITYSRRPTNILWFGELLRNMNLNQYSQAAAQPGLSVDRIKNLLIPCPNYQKQNEIDLYIKTETSTIDTLISKYQNQIDLMQEYRTSLISQAVTGKIDVREE
ncbi:MAG: restriction endonuclease subunit S [Candidatus Omnitrophica bacterium]|nr:restriction endonuclease subunit S [Candidatus Omnitrophota bacterium]